MTLPWESHPYLFYSQWPRYSVSTHFNTSSPIHHTLGKVYQSLTYAVSHHRSPACVVNFHASQLPSSNGTSIPGPICSAPISCCIFLVSFLDILTGPQHVAPCRCVCSYLRRCSAEIPSKPLEPAKSIADGNQRLADAHLVIDYNLGWARRSELRMNRLWEPRFNVPLLLLLLLLLVTPVLQFGKMCLSVFSNVQNNSGSPYNGWFF